MAVAEGEAVELVLRDTAGLDEADRHLLADSVALSEVRVLLVRVPAALAERLGVALVQRDAVGEPELLMRGGEGVRPRDPRAPKRVGRFGRHLFPL